MKQKKKIKIIEGCLVGFLVFIIILGFGTFAANGVISSFFDRVSLTSKIDKDNVVSDEVLANLENQTKVINIALFGVDNRDDDYELENSRSDAMKVISLDTKNNRIVITSLQRDLLVYTPTPMDDFDKLNHAYWNGGAELALKTINYNFDLDINRYVTVNFSGVESIVALAGGIEIDVLPAEVSGTNKWITDLDNIANKNNNTQKLTSSGPQVLTGRQALAYMRNRDVGSDYERMNRQTKVIKALMKKVSTLQWSDIINLLGEVLSYVETNIDQGEMIQLGLEVLQMNADNVEQYQFPANGFQDTKSVSYNGYSPLYVHRSYQQMVKELHHNIYQNEGYNPSKIILDNEIKIYNQFGRID